jgi:hypothetical protein
MPALLSPARKSASPPLGSACAGAAIAMSAAKQAGTTSSRIFIETSLL